MSRRNSLVPLPPIKQGGRVSVQFSNSSGRASKASRRGSIRGPISQSLPWKHQDDEVTVSESEKPKQIVKFVYSEAVERAFRRSFMCPDFGPVYSGKPVQPSVEILKLPELYNEFQLVKGLVARKEEYIQKLRDKSGEDQLKPLKYGKNKYYKGRNRITPDIRRSGMNSYGQISRGGTYQRLPSILSRNDRHSVSSSSLQVI